MPYCYLLTVQASHYSNRPSLSADVKGVSALQHHHCALLSANPIMAQQTSRDVAGAPAGSATTSPYREGGQEKVCHADPRLAFAIEDKLLGDDMPRQQKFLHCDYTINAHKVLLHDSQEPITSRLPVAGDISGALETEQQYLGKEDKGEVVRSFTPGHFDAGVGRIVGTLQRLLSACNMSEHFAALEAFAKDMVWDNPLMLLRGRDNVRTTLYFAKPITSLEMDPDLVQVREWLNEALAELDVVTSTAAISTC